ncbi:TPA: hypothetical protein JBD66_11515 [Legionella pneumophila subsp. pneumophila]|jgi:transposase|nr:hypothetical protein [Legionella pneumophila subsp. pneumophila]HAT9082545.1 hypothetical protein [Legionella pneumophila subsp. pneumophila]HAT9110895.1 hypothetical protein [Legionella pneumophila subsp. pneumophila]HAT9360413.1 hypothetical protein [Legionella pneumophila subsp. pneumophila]HAT9755123.1 hypothetical protein [Legionella pneumophila subsp. pneumophila]
MRQVTKYSAAIKANVLSKALAPNAPGVIELSKEFNIPKATIYTWMHNMTNQKDSKKNNNSERPKDHSSASKFQAVLDTIGKTEEEQSAYCRTHGIYYNHLETWKHQMLEGLNGVPTKESSCSIKESKAINQKMQHEVKQLTRDLNRKDKALAELTALLILKKKADLIWGDSEDA